jgi:hypothetical protein
VHPDSYLGTITPPKPIPQRESTRPVIRYLAVVGLAFLALMMTLEPDVGFAAPLPARLLFWMLQIAAGLFVLQSALSLLAQRYGASRLPSWVLVLLSGVLGAIVLAPVYWLIGEGLVPRLPGYADRPDEGDALLAGFTAIHPLIEEYLDIVGPVTTAWLLICLPRLHWMVPPRLEVGAAGAAAAEPVPAVEPVATVESPSNTVPPRRSWRDRLPQELGTDVIAVSSELQYLRVWTTRGCALVLGALADVESDGAEHGLRVHRSWWVARDHVVSVRRSVAGAVCVMSDGREVPISRRRRSEVLARFGDGARYRGGGSSEAVSEADLH